VQDVAELVERGVDLVEREQGGSPSGGRGTLRLTTVTGC
jgi:hypothetical protein